MELRGLGWIILLSTFFAWSCEYQRKRVPDYIAEGFHVMGDFNKNLFSWDTLKVAFAFTPFYVGTRYIDNELHSCFYCSRHHKNVRQLPRCCYHIANNGITAVSVALAGLSILPIRRDIKDTAIVFGLTLPFVWVWKKLLKEIKTDAHVRPKNQHFSQYKCYYGGCPSGHMLTATYTAAYWGMQLGPWWGVPLGAFAVGIFADLLNSNRHYASQMVAGAGLGFIGAVAASKAADIFKQRDVQCSLVSDAGVTGLRLAWNF